MRQWLVNPEKMCLKHLLGEHVEHHMFVGTLKKHRSITGYLENNLIEPKALVTRHVALAHEIEARGYTHSSPLEEPDLSYLTEVELTHRIDKVAAQTELFNRCEECRKRIIGGTNG